MEVPTLKLALIGAGYVAEEHLKAINILEGLEVELIYSRTLQKANLLGKKFSIPCVVSQLDTFLQKAKELDGILITVSPESMYQICKILLPLKVPLFIEKPPGLSLEEIEELTEISLNFKTPNMVGFNRRFYSIFHKGLSKIDEYGGLIGINIEGHERFWKYQDSLNDEVKSSWIYANSSHTIDLIDFFVGELEELYVNSSSIQGNIKDQFSVSFKSLNGVIGNYTSYWLSPGGWSVSLYGKGVSVIFKPLEKGVWIDSYFQEHDLEPEEYDLEIKEGFYNQIKSFKSLIQNGKLSWPAVSLKDSMRTMKTIEKLLTD